MIVQYCVLHALHNNFISKVQAISAKDLNNAATVEETRIKI